MKRLNFICLSALLGIVVSISSCHAQLLGQVTDNTCTVIQQECDGWQNDGCNTTTFQLQGTEKVRVSAYLQCTDGNSCQYCVSETYLLDSDGNQLVCIHGGCNCTTPAYQDIDLDAGEYTLRSCKLGCDHNCANCPTACTAKATAAAFPR